MYKTSARSIMVLMLLCGCLFGLAAGVGAAQEEEEQWQVPRSRSFGDHIWQKNRRNASKSQPKRRRKYERVGVAGNSATPFKYGKPGQSSTSVPANRRRPTPAKPPMWQDVLLDTSEQVGVTIWRLRKCGPGGGIRCFLELQNEQGGSAMYEALRVNSADNFREGDGVQLAVESRVKGYVYVLHQEIYADGRRPGEPKLLFPQREGVNAVGPGHPLLVPAQGEDGEVKVLKMRNERGRRLLAERLRVIVVPRPLEGLFVKERPRDISDEDVKSWESLWSGRLEVFDLEGGRDERMSLNEWHVMRNGGGGGARDLTTEDLSPQKLYVVERKRSDGVLFTLDLPYGK